ncbi:DUF4397 domain-containing protein [uncultured Amnibacterium sp.]|uniref:DUF4397 domain-containing protein n=1 Tax=uncultured Amnibacterium sp. TaxID=1631851 RepID=UPI0035CAB545
MIAALTTVVAAAVLAVAPAAAASATSTGWVRVAHLSPDTKAVDITLSSLSGAKAPLFKLSNVGYGAVSQYMKLQEGTYALAMVAAGAPAGSPAVVSGQVTVSSSKAETVAAIGLNKDLTTKVFSDDLTQSAGDAARIRVVNASVKHSTIGVDAGSTTIADGVSFGNATAYRTIGAGTAELDLDASSTTAAASVQLQPGTVHTVFVLDNAKGGLSVSSALDSSATTVAPIGSVATGAGAVGRADQASTTVVAGGLAGAAAIAALGLFLLLRRRVAA